jgi:hypothetical protein
LKQVLSTAVLLMFASSGLIAYNLASRGQLLEDGNRYPLRGWPVSGTITPTHYVVFLGEPDGSREVSSKSSRSLNWEIFSTWFLYDAFVNLGVLLILAIALEYLIRRREGRKPPAPP